MESPIKMDDLGVPLFSETPIYFSIFGWKKMVDPQKKNWPRYWGGGEGNPLSNSRKLEIHPTKSSAIQVAKN